MLFKTVGLVTVFFLTTPGVVRAGTDETFARPLLVIRTYQTYQVSSDTLRIAQDAAEVILKDVGIDVRWLDCGQKTVPSIGKSNRCGQPLAPNELMLSIQEKGVASGAQNVSMGFTVVSRRPQDYQPVLSTVYADVVAMIARDAGVDARQLLGYAVAHEIGHLLLNNPEHTEAGLMRALWSRLELRARRRADWVFSSHEAETMRHAIAARINGRP